MEMVQRPFPHGPHVQELVARGLVLGFAVGGEELATQSGAERDQSETCYYDEDDDCGGGKVGHLTGGLAGFGSRAVGRSGPKWRWWVGRCDGVKA